MSKNYLRTIVRTGSRPINPARGDRGRQAQANIEPVAETAMHAIFPPGGEQRRLPHADKPQDPQDIHDDPAPAAEERAAQLNAAGEAVTPAGLRSLAPQDFAVSKTFSVPSPLMPIAQDTTISTRPAVTDNDFPDLRGTAPRLEPQANGALAGSPDSGPIAGAPSVILQAPGKAGRAEEQDERDQEMSAAVIPPEPGQASNTGLRKTGLQGPARGVAPVQAQPGTGSPKSMLPPHPPGSEPRSSLPEGGPRSLLPQEAVQDTPTDLAVFYAAPRESTPKTTKGFEMSAATDRAPLPQGAVKNPRADLKVFYATPQQAASEAAVLPKASVAETESGNAVSSAVREPAINSKEQQKAQIVQPTVHVDSTAQQVTPAATGGPRTAEGGEQKSIPVPASTAKPQSAPPVLVREATPELPPRELFAARPREQAQMPQGGGVGPSRRDESGPRLLIHRLDVQIVTQKQPEPPRQRAQPQPAAAPRAAWEGVDRHYLHRSSVGA